MDDGMLVLLTMKNQAAEEPYRGIALLRRFSAFTAYNARSRTKGDVNA
jgi:hypothetical protein